MAVYNGTSGNNYYYGTSDDDTITGNQGHDSLRGDAGDDTFIYNLGDGNDSIYEQDGADDVIQFGTGITQENTNFSFNYTSLTMTFSDGGSIFSLYQYNNDIDGGIERFLFDDGSELSSIDLQTTFLEEASTDGDDFIYGFYNSDDTIHGGLGNDTLYGRTGNDTYLYAIGDGFDTLSDDGGDNDILAFTDDTTLADLTFEKGSYYTNIFKDGVKILDLPPQIERITFADGTEITEIEIRQAAIAEQQTDGDDNVIGNDNFDDTLEGGLGNDTLRGRRGEDTYIYNLGDGNDTIYETNSDADIIQFGAGLTQDDVSFINGRFSLTIGFEDGGTLFIANQHGYAGNFQAIASFVFEDGTILSKSEVADLSFAASQTDGDDSIYGYTFEDNTIEGGLGDDSITSGNGADTYVYNLGDGNDTINEFNSNNGNDDVITLGEGITQDNISFSHDSRDILLTMSDGGSMQLEYQTFRGSGINYANRGIEKVIFSDGSELTAADIEAIARNNPATDGNDTIYGFGLEDETFEGGLGDDLINGYEGDDSYIYNLGDGNDTIDDYRGEDELTLGSGIDRYNTQFSRDAAALIMTFTNGESIRLENQLRPFAESVDIIRFADDSILDTTYLIPSFLASEQTDGDDYIIDFDNRNDFISGGLGNDTLISEHINEFDTLYGGEGADVLISQGQYSYTTFLYTNINESSRDNADEIQLDYSSRYEYDYHYIDISALPFYNLIYGNDALTQAGELKLYTDEDSGNHILTSDQEDFSITLNFNDPDGIFDAEKEIIFGSQSIIGSDGNDLLEGGLGDDTLDGGLGRDTLVSASEFDNDTFVFSDVTHSTAATRDVIRNYTPYKDSIDLSALPFFGFDDDGGRTEDGELRVHYNDSLDRTYVLSDQIDFRFYLEGNQTNYINNYYVTFQDKLITGTDGDDNLVGGAGNDTIEGGLGRDTITESDGKDVYLISDLDHSRAANPTYITNQYIIHDIIDVSALPFYSLDTDGGRTEDGELRSFYNSNSDRTYLLSDQEDFRLYVDGNQTNWFREDGFIFNSKDLLGTEGNDALEGGSANDTLDGGAGRDTLTGGSGEDIFVFSDITHSTNASRDAITDFDIPLYSYNDADLIDLSALAFTGLDTDGGLTDFIFYFEDANLTDGSLTDDSFIF